MKSVNFPQANVPLAKNQPEYQTLHVHYDLSNTAGEMTACMELTDEEIAEIIKTKRVYLTQLTFHNGYHPVRMSVVSPYKYGVIPENPPADENRTPADVWDKTHFLSPGGDINIPCHNCGKAWADHYWSDRQCEL